MRLIYVAHQHLTGPTKFLVYEHYTDQTALHAHRAARHFRQYVRQEPSKAPSPNRYLRRVLK